MTPEHSDLWEQLRRELDSLDEPERQEALQEVAKLYGAIDAERKAEDLLAALNARIDRLEAQNKELKEELKRYHQTPPADYGGTD
jgi:ribosome-associated translation inhibitor RaiA